MSDGEHETGIDDMFIEEFDMYLHHQRERNEQFNKRWLRTMFYSLSQQIVRQNIEYWALYVFDQIEIFIWFRTHIMPNMLLLTT